MVDAVEQRSPWERGRTIICWVVSATLALGGASTLLDDTLWPEARAHGAILLALAAALLPPVLRGARAHAAWTRPWWVPALFGLVVLVLAVPAANIFKLSSQQKEASRNEAIKRARLLLASGDRVGARRTLLRFSREIAADPRIVVLVREADRPPAAPPADVAIPVPTPTATREVPQSAEANFAERAETYWIPQTRAISASEPRDLDDYHARLNDLSVQADYLEDGYTLTLDPKQRAVRSRFAAALSARQTKLFPMLRRAYGRIANQNLFRQDVSVAVVGSRADTIRFTGSIFARNANIADFEEGLESELKKVRFRRVEYRWSRYLSETRYYTFKTPGDAATGATDMDGNFRSHDAGAAR